VALDPGSGGEGVTVTGGQGVGSWVLDGEWRHATVEIGPEGCIEGTDRPLTGVLFAYLDVVTGSPPSGAMNPTVDLQIRLFSRPRRGRVRFTARTLRLGRTLYVGEAELRHEDTGALFGVGVATFVNLPVPFPERTTGSTDPSVARPELTYTALVEAKRVGAGIFELEADIHTVQGTVSGATLGRLAELAAMDLLAAEFTSGSALDELDVRFLNKVRVGSLMATATALGRRDGAVTVRIEVRDRGDDDRLVTYALAVCREMRLP
jgi:acyl-coenzyme A thioesterase PaaI-like protein